MTSFNKENLETIKKWIIKIHNELVSKNNDPKELRESSNIDFLIYDAFKKTNKIDIDSSIKLMINIAENHPFIEGNKRTAYVVGKTLLGYSGRLLCINENIAIKYLKILAIKHEKFNPHNFKDIKSWLLFNCEIIPKRNKKIDKYLQRFSKTYQRKIKKYLKFTNYNKLEL